MHHQLRGSLFYHDTGKPNVYQTTDTLDYIGLVSSLKCLDDIWWWRVFQARIDIVWETITMPIPTILSSYIFSPQRAMMAQKDVRDEDVSSGLMKGTDTGSEIRCHDTHCIILKYGLPTNLFHSLQRHSFSFKTFLRRRKTISKG